VTKRLFVECRDGVVAQIVGPVGVDAVFARFPFIQYGAGLPPGVLANELMVPSTPLPPVRIRLFQNERKLLHAVGHFALACIFHGAVAAVRRAFDELGDLNRLANSDKSCVFSERFLVLP
jgi:hypothetical protein